MHFKDHVREAPSQSITDPLRFVTGLQYSLTTEKLFRLEHGGDFFSDNTKIFILENEIVIELWVHTN